MSRGSYLKKANPKAYKQLVNNRRKRLGARKGMRKNVKNVKEFASMSCVRTLEPINNNTMYTMDGIILADYQRAVAVARNYQRYRMTGVKLTIKPTFDTYSPATANQKPFLYHMIDKNGSIPDTVTLEGLKQAGARPRALDERSLSIFWKPAVLGESRINAGIPQAAQYVVSPWLSTAQNPTAPGVWNPSEVSHQGVKFYVEQAGATQRFELEIEVQFQFIKPLFPSLSATPAQRPVYATLDASPDGIQGGSDGVSIPLST